MRSSSKAYHESNETEERANGRPEKDSAAHHDAGDGEEQHARTRQQTSHSEDAKQDGRNGKGVVHKLIVQGDRKTGLRVSNERQHKQYNTWFKPRLIQDPTLIPAQNEKTVIRPNRK